MQIGPGLLPYFQNRYTLTMASRRQKPTHYVARMRGYDFSCGSDEELRSTFAEMRSLSKKEVSDDLLCRAFAIVAESVDRRLGAWRVFNDSSVERGGLGGSREAPAFVTGWAKHVASQRQYRRDGDILLPAEFYSSLSQSDTNGQFRFRVTDEQLMASIHLFRGSVVQMDAGEGKTVAAACTAAVHALLGHPVHLVTANDYLADRDWKLLDPVYRSLGLSTGAVLQHVEAGERRQIYQRDVVYASMREFGFDYLRDNLKSDISQRVLQPGRLGDTIAIVDEADHALIDEAFTPMIISGNPMGSTRAAIRADRAVSEMIARQRIMARELAVILDSPGLKVGEHAKLASRLLLADPENPSLKQLFSNRPGMQKQAWTPAQEEHSSFSEDLLYTIHPARRFVTLTDNGRDFLEQRLGPLYNGGSTHQDCNSIRRDSQKRAHRGARRMSRRYGLGNQVLQSLRAHLLLKRGVDYLVGDDGIVLIDQHSGRARPDNIYQHGLQAAVEAKEGVRVHPEAETLAWVSVAGFAGLYRQVCGITGTAEPATGEFRSKYGLEVAVVPPAKSSARTVRGPLVYLTREDKLAAVVERVADRHRMGQPVLVAAQTVEQSEELSRELNSRGVPHNLLNAVTSASEARIIREAGNFEAVTVSTPMAGRGTDILLQPALSEMLADRCVYEIQRLLALDAYGVSVWCASKEQASLLADAMRSLALASDVKISDENARVSVNGGRGEGYRELEFSLGLCVIGAEIYDSRRTELQLYGRSGRQGEYGLTQTFLSLEDRIVDLQADGFLKLRESRGTDEAGRPCYAGPKVARLVRRLQARADSEEEAVRGFMQDYAAEFDRQTNLYYRLRQQVAGSLDIESLCTEAVQRVASRLASRHLGREADDRYTQRFPGDGGGSAPRLRGRLLTLVRDGPGSVTCSPGRTASVPTGNCRHSPW